ncbi:MAG: UbiA family prenyltransferase [Brumimicrobium sp.]|nr:UbiA family prenyltransferase [Brumimicrobium sp.]
MISFLRLIRISNLLIIALTMYGLGFYFDNLASQSYVLYSFDFFALVLIVIFIAAAGNIINDINDILIDQLNKPKKLIVDTFISKRKALILYGSLNFIAIQLAMYVWFKTDEIVFLCVPLATVILLWLYAVYIKKWLVTGNLVVSILTAIVPMLVGIYFFTLKDIVMTNPFPFSFPINTSFSLFFSGGISIFAFLLNFSREIVKDMEDVEGDKVYHVRSIPVVWGMNVAKGLTVLLLIIFLAFVSFIVNYFQLGLGGNWVISPLILSAFAVIYTIFLLMKTVDKKNLHSVSNLLKLAMALGLLTPWLWAIIISF